VLLGQRRERLNDTPKCEILPRDCSSIMHKLAEGNKKRRRITKQLVKSTPSRTGGGNRMQKRVEAEGGGK